jgi:hypothetical protein
VNIRQFLKEGEHGEKDNLIHFFFSNYLLSSSYCSIENCYLCVKYQNYFKHVIMLCWVIHFSKFCMRIMHMKLESAAALWHATGGLIFFIDMINEILSSACVDLWSASCFSVIHLHIKIFIFITKPATGRKKLHNFLQGRLFHCKGFQYTQCRYPF